MRSITYISCLPWAKEVKEIERCNRLFVVTGLFDIAINDFAAKNLLAPSNRTRFKRNSKHLFLFFQLIFESTSIPTRTTSTLNVASVETGFCIPTLSGNTWQPNTKVKKRDHRNIDTAVGQMCWDRPTNTFWTLNVCYVGNSFLRSTCEQENFTCKKKNKQNKCHGPCLDMS